MSNLPDTTATGAERVSPGVCNRAAIPDSAGQRERMRGLAFAYVRDNRLVPPLTLDELQAHTAALCVQNDIDTRHMNFATILLGNALWWETLAAVPYERRVFLLPMCLRARETCEAEIDEFGLLCMQCGGCVIGRLQKEAEDLGYVFLVAEGTTVVTSLLDSGKVDAVIGVSCLSTLERTFPHMSAHAIPGVAIPLIRDGCEATALDLEWALEALRLHEPNGFLQRRSLPELRQDVDAWFGEGPLRDVLGGMQTETERLALEWLAGEGKRWRPLLVAAVYSALSQQAHAIPLCVRQTAVAVECFHKASLVHDDIEDNDRLRYGRETLHYRYGVPVALNVGDLLIGEGYRLLGQLDAPSDRKAQLAAVAAEGHRTLCLGQGAELAWMGHPRPLAVAETIELFSLKTAPAFDVALRFGSICAGHDEALGEILRKFSRALGVAYQISDDIEDFSHQAEASDTVALRPSLLMALLYEDAAPAEKTRIERHWLERAGDVDLHELHAMADRRNVMNRARQLLEHYRNEAVRSLGSLDNAHLKSLLHRVMARII